MFLYSMWNVATVYFLNTQYIEIWVFDWLKSLDKKSCKDTDSTLSSQYAAFQATFTYSNLTVEVLYKGMKHVQS